jgi:F-type H+-transporting ATPase subunit gamma
MANLKEIRARIVSVGSTQQITKAMKMVSAAKLRRAQNAIVQLRPYSNKLNAMLSNLLSNTDGDSSSSFGVKRPVENVCIVVVTSNRGLCGAFNSNVIKSAVATMNEKYPTQLAAGKITILPIGKRGAEFFKKRYANLPIISDFIEIFGDLTSDNVARASQMVMDNFAAKKFDAVEISYGRFRNAAMQFPETEQFLPVAKIETPVGAAPKKKADYIFEPDQASLLEHLIPSILHTQFLKCCLDTHASEHGARMTSMDKATENAEELIKGLKITYNKARQEAITKELSEIVGGAAALEG